MAAECGDGFDVGLDAGAAARIRSRDAEDTDRVFHGSISVRAVFPPHPPAAAKAPAGKLSQRWSAVASREGGPAAAKAPAGKLSQRSSAVTSPEGGNPLP